jgi:hypothetical protein
MDTTDRAQIAALGAHLAATAPAEPAPWMQTYSGRAFYPLNPQPAHIDLEDVAHGLSNLCRYGGQCRVFYSVAEHSVLLSYAVPEHLARWALLHDASEAYLSDVIRPIKPHLRGYYDIEDQLMGAIAVRFDLFPWPMPAELKGYDERMLLNEQARLMAPPPMPWNVLGEPLSGISISGWLPMHAKLRFLARATELGLR